MPCQHVDGHDANPYDGKRGDALIEPVLPPHPYHCRHEGEGKQRPNRPKLAFPSDNVDEDEYRADKSENATELAQPAARAQRRAGF